MDIAKELSAGLDELQEKYADAWSADDKARAHATATRLIELHALQLAGQDVTRDLQHMEAQALTIAQRGALKGRMAIKTVVDRVLRKGIEALLAAV